MNKAKITFSNNESLIVKEGDLLVPITSFETKEGISSSMGEPCELWSHINDGLLPSLTELLYRGKFFFHIENKDIFYSTSAIVKIENL